LVVSGLQEHRAQHGLYATLREQLAAETAPVGGVVKDGAPIATLSVPALGLNKSVVVEGTTSTDLQNGPGHRVDTVFPGQAGVSVVFGKSATFGAPFGKLTSLKPGDVITATTGQGSFTYHVIDVRTPGMPFPPAVTGTAGRLILVSAYGHGWRSGWAPSQVVYVDANLQGAGKASPGGGPTAQPANQVAMARDDTALTPLVLWLELLIVAAVGFVWSRRHWGTWQVWLVGAPALFAVIWVVTETATRLLPNLL
jgi:sortase A